MHPRKYFWVIRAILGKISFKKFGNMSYMGKPLFIEGKSRISIGSHTRIFPGIRIEAIGTGEVEIGDNTVIEQNAHIISMRNLLRIGRDVTLAPNVFITNVNHEYRDIEKSVMDQGYLFDETCIGDGCFIGYGVAIQSGTKLGKHCIVGSNAVVKGEFPDYCVIVGNPARVLKKYDVDTNEWKKVE